MLQDYKYIRVAYDHGWCFSFCFCFFIIIFFMLLAAAGRERAACSQARRQADGGHDQDHVPAPGRPTGSNPPAVQRHSRWGGGGDRSPDIFSGLLVISSINCTFLFCCFFVLFSITLICHVCWCSYIGVMPCCLLVSSLVLLVFYKIYINSMAVFFSC